MNKTLRLTIAIPTKDREPEILRCIESIISQTTLPDTLIVVDASKEDNLKLKIEEKIQTTSITFQYFRSSPGAAHQRNIALNALKDDIVLILDDDVILHKNYIREMKRAFEKDEERKIGGATGKTTNLYQFRWPSLLIRKLFFLSEPGKGDLKVSGAHNPIAPTINKEMFVSWLPGYNMAFRREVIQKLKFDENLHGYSYLEDVDFSFQVSKRYKLVFTPKAQIQHLYKTAPSTRLNLFEKQKMYMINYYYFFRKHFPHRFEYFFFHFWSYIGQILRSILLLRNWGAFIGTLAGIFVNVSGKNPLVQAIAKSKFRD